MWIAPTANRRWIKCIACGIMSKIKE